MINLIFYAIAIYLMLIASLYFIVFQRLLKTALQYPQHKLTPADAVPTYLKELFQKPVTELEQLGFQFFGNLQVKRMLSLDIPQEWQVLLYHQTCKTYAAIAIRRPAEAVNLFEINFFTFFKDRSLLLTTNGQAHGFLGEMPNTIVHDPYTARLESHWQAHRDKLKQLTATKMPCGLSPDSFLQALQSHYAVYMDSLSKSGQLARISGTELYQLSWLTALKLTFKVQQGSRKAAAIVKQRREHAKTDATLKTEIPVELEVEGFHRMQQIEQGRVQRKLGNWLLFGSLALFAASFTPLLNWQRLLILIGVVFFHEVGHFSMMRLCGYQDTSIFFLPFFGAAAMGRKDSATLTEKVLVLLAGPVPGLLVGIGIIAFSGSGGPSWLRVANQMLLVINLFNLLPIYPLDGGKIANLLLFSRYSYTDVLFKVFAAIVLVLLGSGNPISLGLGVLVGLSIPAGFRSAKVDATLRQERLPASIDTDRLLHAIFRIIKQSGYGTLPFIQRYNLVKEVVQRHREAHAKWTTRVGLSILYCAFLLGGLMGGFQGVIRSHQLEGRENAIYLRERQAGYKKEIESAEQALRVNPNDAKAYFKRGTAHLLLGDCQATIEDANQILRLDSNSGKAYFMRSFARRRLGDERGAMEDRQKAHALIQSQWHKN